MSNTTSNSDHVYLTSDNTFIVCLENGPESIQALEYSFPKNHMPSLTQKGEVMNVGEFFITTPQQFDLLAEKIKTGQWVRLKEDSVDYHKFMKLSKKADKKTNNDTSKTCVIC